MGHYVNLGLYAGLFTLSSPVEFWMKNLTPKQQYYFHRWIDASKYGSGN
jgi:lycopene cyclase CruP